MTDSSFSDDAKAQSLLNRSLPDAEHQRRRRWLIVGGAVVVAALLVGGGTWLATRGGSDDSAQHAPVLPTAFAGYKEAAPHDTEWTEIGSDSVNTDITKGRVNLTYRAPGGKALIIRAQYWPHATLEPAGPNDELRSVYNSAIDPRRVKTYPAGAVGGKIRCADITTGAVTFTTCGWHNNTTDVTLAPMLNHREIVSAEAPAYLRTFINALKIAPSQ
ncbi:MULTISPECIES: hypothetical protein [unclassified Streptomyces]|uniref:hypothetical protein n=1 Tax=unclassified Streptomyces TaxID=2593676 RepID=UPI002251E358|nr:MULTISPECIES: hypothetical protein [unclassified Streptomyces]MCX4880096.1 hypothetical protein [Streptomyces sp. NBC_00847]MCX5047461.1 hypothetical protein [Streptomyces sp. NBC_00474]MCX5420091.1 hypothetical protein [Streptomyces sp. NBC_00078]